MLLVSSLGGSHGALASEERDGLGLSSKAAKDIVKGAPGDVLWKSCSPIRRTSCQPLLWGTTVYNSLARTLGQPGGAKGPAELQVLS